MIEGYLFAYGWLLIPIAGIKWGWWGVIGALIPYLVLVWWINRDQIRLAQDQIAILFWGKPLRKDFWDKGEKPGIPAFLRRKKNVESTQSRTAIKKAHQKNLPKVHANDPRRTDERARQQISKRSMPAKDVHKVSEAHDKVRRASRRK